jgi:hypothetical protein
MLGCRRRRGERRLLRMRRKFNTSVVGCWSNARLSSTASLSVVFFVRLGQGEYHNFVYIRAVID